MQKLMLIFGFLLITQIATAQNDAPPLTTTEATRWFSKDSQDTITLDNPGGKEIVIQIAVDDDQLVPGITGIVVYNCDKDEPKKYVKPGSTITCTTHDENNPVRIESDRAGISASGTYVIKTR
jgi:hypothetical protein